MWLLKDIEKYMLDYLGGFYLPSNVSLQEKGRGRLDWGTQKTRYENRGRAESDATTSQGHKTCQQPLETKKDKEQIPPITPSPTTASRGHMTLLTSWHQTLDLQNCERINFTVSFIYILCYIANFIFRKLFFISNQILPNCYWYSHRLPGSGMILPAM